MKPNTKILWLSLCTLGLTACNILDQNSNFDYNKMYRQETPLYPDSYETVTTYQKPQYKESLSTPSGVSVPESYHVSTTGSPISARNSDNSWVLTQNPKAYTIELINSDTPLSVADKMKETPKNNRVAEIKSTNGQNTRYIAVYGTYSTYEDAEAALNALPQNVKEGAGVQKWSSIQAVVQ